MIWRYIKHLDKLREDYKKRFGDLNNKHIPQWLVTPIDIIIDNNDYE